MSLDAKTIRHDTAARLKARFASSGSHKTSAKDRIFPSRMLPIQNDETLPLLVINTPTETGNTESKKTGTPQFANTLTLRIEGTVSAAKDANVEDALDDLDEQVRETLLTDPEWVKQFEEIERLETIKGLDLEGDTRHGVIIITMTLQSRIIFEPVIDDDFTKIHINVDAIDPYDPNKGSTGPDGVHESEIDITLPAPVGA